jgi:Domain of unknown function (DUF4190)/Septum formation
MPGAPTLPGAPAMPAPPSWTSPEHATSGKVPKSTAALVLGIVGLVPIVLTAVAALLALIFGLKGRAANKASGNRLTGGGKATAGIVLGVLGLLFNAGILAVGISGALKQDSIDNIKVGRCYDSPETGSTVSSLKKQDCAKLHDSEAFFVFDVQDGVFPGQDEVMVTVQTRCAEEFEKFVGLSILESELDMFTIAPSKDSWDKSQTGICLILDEGNPVTGSLKGANR